jgi:hypothetical protein
VKGKKVKGRGDVFGLTSANLENNHKNRIIQTMKFENTGTI